MVEPRTRSEITQIRLKLLILTRNAFLAFDFNSCDSTIFLPWINIFRLKSDFSRVRNDVRIAIETSAVM